MTTDAAVPFLELRSAYTELRVDLDEAMARVAASGWYLLGGELTAFEREWATYVGAEHAVGVSNGLDALVLALRALDIGPGDEVVVPANTYIATWLAVSAVGATPVAVDPVPGLWNIDAVSIERAMTHRTKAILPVHLYGQPVEMESLLSVARARGVSVIEDAAQAHGAKVGGRRIGTHGDLVCWSFYPGKNLGAFGDGGGITTNDARLADRLRVLRNYGSRVKYHNEVRGMNARLDELQAAVLRVKLGVLDEWNARRRRIAERYLAALNNIAGLTLPVVVTGSEHAWHLFVIDHAARDSLRQHLEASGIQTLIHYPIPPHLSGAYADLGLPPGTFPVTERAATTHLSLPIGPHLATEDVGRVIEAVLRFQPTRREPNA